MDQPGRFSSHDSVCVLPLPSPMSVAVCGRWAVATAPEPGALDKMIGVNPATADPWPFRQSKKWRQFQILRWGYVPKIARQCLFRAKAGDHLADEMHKVQGVLYVQDGNRDCKNAGNSLAGERRRQPVRNSATFPTPGRTGTLFMRGVGAGYGLRWLNMQAACLQRTSCL
jgi:hypothetical protein